VGSLENVLGSSLRPHAVAALDLVLERDLLTGQMSGDRLQADELRVKPAVLGQLSELCRVLGELGGCLQLFGFHPLRELGRAVVGVDQPVGVAAQPQAQLDVGVGDLHYERSKSAAWPWPTPTHRVARP
jgi:hypothetical protein